MKVKSIAGLFQAPTFSIEHKDGSYEVFDGYDDLYKELHDRKDPLLGTIMGFAELILLFGDVPIKYVEAENKFYTLGWDELKSSNQIAKEKEEKHE